MRFRLMLSAELHRVARQIEELFRCREQLDECFRVLEGVDGRSTFGTGDHQSGVLEAGEVLGDGALREPQVLGQVNDAMLTELEMLKDN